MVALEIGPVERVEHFGRIVSIPKRNVLLRIAVETTVGKRCHGRLRYRRLQPLEGGRRPQRAM